MGSSGEGSEKGIDPTVGGLVWVRRRNGSWWPGRILGLDEVSESCVVSPRSGTPVKLLGREDASVDWYNLEKSKRVKAFRCGEYDDCIAKAKASVANSSRKAVKYARREDAIIHALEIENSQLGIDKTDVLVSTREGSLGRENGTSTRDLPSVSHSDGDDDDVSDSKKNSDSSAQDLAQSGISFEEPNHMSSSKVKSMQGRRRSTPNDSEDDGMGGVKRMRGLKDLGVSAAASKRKVQAGGGLLELVKLENASLSEPNHVKSLPNGNSTVNGTRGNSMKRKRTPMAISAEFSKKKNRRRPLIKVLESTTVVMAITAASDPVPGSSDSKVFEPADSKRSTSVTINNKLDCNGVSNGTSINASEPACEESHGNKTTKENGISSTLGSADNGSSDRVSDMPFAGEQKKSAGLSAHVQRPSALPNVKCANEMETGSTTLEATHANIGQRLEKGTSKWQSKGKRNSRKINRNSKQESRNVEPNTCPTGIDRSDKKYLTNGISGSPGSFGTDPKPVSNDGGSEPVAQRLLPHRQSRFTVNSRYRAVDSTLFEVKVEVKVNDRPPHVPLVSLMSKLTGKPIIGHPVAVEALEDGFCDRLLRAVEVVVEEVVEEEEEVVGSGGVTSELEPPGSRNKRVPVKGRVLKHVVVLQPQVSPRKLLPRKLPKTKKSGLLPKKIRKLSSLTGGKKSEVRKAATVVEKPKGTVIACVPLKLVFSRINEAVNGSARQTLLRG